MTDVDAVTERLNGLVNLLHVVGIDGVDPDALVEEQKKLNAHKSSNSTPTTQSSDSQILEIIKKLQQAQADSPEILAALKSPELRALASLAAQKQPRQEQKQAPAPSLDDVMDDDDNYPKIGPGYSDDISVVSDLTTPTVVNSKSVAEEEFYKDVNGGPGALPPMHIGLGASQPSRPAGGHAPKQKNLVSQVKPGASRRAIAKSGGAAAQRRLNYQQAMAKLQSSDYGTPKTSKKDKNYMANFSAKKSSDDHFATSPTPSKLPSELPSLAAQGKKVKHTRNKAAVKDKKGRKTALAAQEEADFELDSDPQAPKFDQVAPSGGSVASSGGRKKKDKDSKDRDWGGKGGGKAGGAGWPAFGDMGAGAKSDQVFVDNDGFFPSGDFGTGAEAFKTSKSPKPGRKEARDDGQGSTKPRRTKKDNEWASDKTQKKEKGKKQKGRRASLSM